MNVALTAWKIRWTKKKHLENVHEKYHAMMFARIYVSEALSKYMYKYYAYLYFTSISFLLLRDWKRSDEAICIQVGSHVCQRIFCVFVCVLKHYLHAKWLQWHGKCIACRSHRATFFIQLQFCRCARPSIQILISVSFTLAVLLAFIIFSRFACTLHNTILFLSLRSNQCRQHEPWSKKARKPFRILSRQAPKRMKKKLQNEKWQFRFKFFWQIDNLTQTEK